MKHSYLSLEDSPKPQIGGAGEAKWILRTPQQAADFSFFKVPNSPASSLNKWIPLSDFLLYLNSSL